MGLEFRKALARRLDRQGFAFAPQRHDRTELAFDTLPVKCLCLLTLSVIIYYRFLWLFEPLSPFCFRHPTAVTPLFAATCTCPTVCDRARTPDLDNKNLEKMNARKNFWNERTGLPRVARTWRAHNSRGRFQKLSRLRLVHFCGTIRRGSIQVMFILVARFGAVGPAPS